jgi:hypothetical protein
MRNPNESERTGAPVAESTPRRVLRLWPGIAAIVLLLFFRFGVKILIPGPHGFFRTSRRSTA